MSDILSQADHIDANAAERFASLTNLEEVQQFFVDFLGKKGAITLLFKELKAVAPEQKKTLAPRLQKLKGDWQTKFDARQTELQASALDAVLDSDWLDVTKSIPFDRGSIHPVAQIQREIETIFTRMGFEILDGPEVETEWNNFDALNVPDTHPARDMQDTFFVHKNTDDSHKNAVLRTQGTCVDIRRMIERGVPARAIAPARVFRNEAVDATHDATFYQVDGFLVDKNISLGHLKGVVHTMLSTIFKKDVKVRFRPGYFPFVEPGLEVDLWWEYTDKNGKPQGKWLEFMGAGMLHPNVLRNCNVDPEEYSGFAFGFGLTRLAMMRYGVDDIRLLFSNKKEFLEQF